MDKEKEIQKNNLETSIEFLRQEQRKESEFLSGLIRERKEAEKALSFIRSELEMEKGMLHGLIDGLVIQQNNLQAKQEETDLARKKFDSDLVDLKLKEKELLKSLGWINDKILKGEDEEKRVLSRIHDNEEKIVLQEKTILDILSLQNEKAGIEKERDLLRLSISEIQAKADQDFAKIAEDVEKLTAIALEKTKEADEAEYRRNNFETEYAAKSRDLDIYYNRVKEAFNKAFPGKEMPMLS